MSRKIYSGINIQWPISELISTGKKTIETRTYSIPEKYINVDLALIETPGKTGNFKARITAIIRFTKCFEYKNKTLFYQDIHAHCVDKNSPWAWNEKPKWGWKVEVIKVLKHPVSCTSKGITFRKNILL